MTGNVAQVFVADRAWDATLRAACRSLRPGGHVVFETRNPDGQAWLAWNREQSYKRTDMPGVGVVESWVEVTAMASSLVTFRWTFAFEADGAVLTSDSTLRFRTQEEIADSML